MIRAAGASTLHRMPTNAHRERQESHIAPGEEVRDPLADPAAVRAARARPMAERLELALNWNRVASELAIGLAAIRAEEPPKP